MSRSFFAFVFFIYGLAFFCMGLVVWLERGRGSDHRLRHALRPLAVFGILHGIHEWQEMFRILDLLPGGAAAQLLWAGLQLALLAFSFLSLAAFGASLLAPDERIRRISLLLPLLLAAIWVFGLLALRGRYLLGDGLLDAADVWTRYVLGIPAAIVASAGLIAQQRAFRRAGMTRFGRDTLWAAIAFAWYGMVGQLFTRQSPLPPSTVINQSLFLNLFGFPVQLLRAAAATLAAVFVIRFLRSFEVEQQRQISELQEAQLEESRQREALRGEMLGRIVAAQEAERKRIARELHDETGQALTAAGMGLRGAAASLPNGSKGTALNLMQLEQLVSRALTELQRLIADLRPSHLDDLGLPAALRWWAEEVQDRSDLRVTVISKGTEKTLPAPIRLALFRVVQEALNNTIKHAAATTALVELSFDEAAVSAVVTDNGCGFDLQQVMADKERRSWGLLGMKERASLFGGDVTVETQPAAGTRVAIVLPYQLQSLPENSEVINDNPSFAR